MSKVGIIMGSDSDLPIMQQAIDILKVLILKQKLTLFQHIEHLKNYLTTLTTLIKETSQ